MSALVDFLTRVCINRIDNFLIKINKTQMKVIGLITISQKIMLNYVTYTLGLNDNTGVTIILLLIRKKIRYF